MRRGAAGTGPYPNGARLSPQELLVKYLDAAKGNNLRPIWDELCLNVRERRVDLNQIPEGKSFGFIHQLAFWGNTVYLNRLMELTDGDLPFIDLGIPSAYGEDILSIASQKWQFDFVVEARAQMVKCFNALPKTDANKPKRDRLMRALQPLPPMVFNGVDTNVPEEAEYPPVLPAEAPCWMRRCREEARLANPRGCDEDWLLARLPFDRDPDLAMFHRYLEALLPVHRTNHLALANFLDGGAMMGLQSFFKMKEIFEAANATNLKYFVHWCLYDLSDRISPFTGAADFDADLRRDLGQYCELRFLQRVPECLEELDSKGKPPRQFGRHLQALRDFAGKVQEELRGNADDFYERKIKKTGQLPAVFPDLGEGRTEKTAKERIDSEVNILAERVAEVITRGTKVGIGQKVDQVLGTNHNLFAILGPNNGYEYGEVAFVFKKATMWHPDTNLTPQAMSAYLGIDHLASRRGWVRAGFDGRQDLPTDAQIGWDFNADVIAGCEQNVFTNPTALRTEVSCLRGTPELSVHQAMYARRREMLNPCLSPGCLEELARSAVASARTALVGARALYGGRPNSPYPGKEVDRLQDPAGVTLPIAKAKVNFDVVKAFHLESEAHAHIEVHMPRCVTREALEYLFVTPKCLRMLKSERPGSYKRLCDGAVLPDGRKIQIQEAGGGWTSKTPETLEIVDASEDLHQANQAMFEAQRRYFDRRHSLAERARRKDWRDYEEEQLLYEPRGLTLRTPVMSKWKAVWLPQLPLTEYRNGLAISFESNSETGVSVQFCASIQGGPSETYCINIGQFVNTHTRVLKARLHPSFEERRKETVTHTTGPASSFLRCGPRGQGKGVRWTRLWAGVRYEGADAYVMFGELGTDGVPEQVQVTRDGSVPQHPNLSRPVLRDTEPIRHICYVGFSSQIVHALVRDVQVHQAPHVRQV